MLFSDGSDLKGVTRVQDIKYMRYLRVVMRHLCAWPGHTIGEPISHWKIRKHFMDLNSSMALLGGVVFIRLNFGRLALFDMVITYITVFMTVMCLARCLTIWKKGYNEIFKGFIEVIHLFNIRNQSPYAMKIHLYVHKFSHFFSLYMISSIMWGISFFNVIPLMNNINNGGFKFPPPENITYEVSVHYALPFDYQHNFNGYLAVSTFNFFECYLAGSYFCTIDLYLGLLMFHLWGHLKIIAYDLENFPRPAPKANAMNSSNSYERYSKEELQEVRKKIKEIVEHHNLILKYIKDVSDVFSPAIAVSYAFYQVCGFLLLFVCSHQDSALVRFGPMSGVLFSLLIQMSLIFELVSSMRDQLITAAYEVPWECMDPSNRKSVLMILRQVQRPLGLKAVGMVEVGCNTMVQIIKTSISYFAMLRTMED